jgi:hypothetical protein
MVVIYRINVIFSELPNLSGLSDIVQIWGKIAETNADKQVFNKRAWLINGSFFIE